MVLMHLKRCFTQLSFSEQVVLIFLMIIVIGSIVGVPAIYLTRKTNLFGETTILQTATMSTTTVTILTTTVFAPTDIILNHCTVSISNLSPLLYLVNQTDLTYTKYTLTYYTRMNSTHTTIVFGFRNDDLWWRLDNIAVVDTITNVKVNFDGDFEFNDLIRFYSQCNEQIDRNYYTDKVASTFPKSGRYYYEAITSYYTSYLIQSFPTTGERWYKISFWLSAYGSRTNHFIFLIGS